jgi:hypothetical protein
MLLSRRELKTTTPSTLLLGVASQNGKSAATAAIRMVDGEVESDCGQWVAANVFEVVTTALDELQLAKLRQLVILTTDQELLEFLTPPIFVVPTETAVVTLGRQKFKVKVGGDPYQWWLLRLLFAYTWNCLPVAKLPKAEELIR